MHNSRLLYIHERHSFHFNQVLFQSVLTRMSYQHAKKCRHTDRQTTFQLLHSRWHHTVEALSRFDQHNNLVFHILLIIVVVKFCPYNNPSCKVVLQCYKVINTLHKMPQSCENLVTTLQGCNKVATTMKFP